MLTRHEDVVAVSKDVIDLSAGAVSSARSRRPRSRREAVGRVEPAGAREDPEVAAIRAQPAASASDGAVRPAGV